MVSFSYNGGPNHGFGVRRVASARKPRLRSILLPSVALLVAAFFMASPAVADVPTFTVGWSVYAGWNPYFYMQKSGILKKWADKYGIAIKVQRFDYAASLD